MSVLINDVREVFHEIAAKYSDKMLDNGEKFALQEGSPTNGRAWRLYVTGGQWGTGMASAPLTQDRGYIGWTKREAYTELCRIASEYERN